MKTKLSQAIAAVAVMGAATAASAATVNANGMGDTLLYPLYTVEAGNNTVLHLTNTENEYKAVKVRFRRAVDSLDVLDFNLYLSPKDQWTGVLGKGEDGNPILVSGDTSCVAGSDANLNLQTGKSFARDESTKGHIEVIEMGTWTQAQAAAVRMDRDVTGLANNNLAYAVKHDDGVPGNCGLINKAWYYDENGVEQPGLWADEYLKSAKSADGTNAADATFKNTALGNAPKGGLYGTAYVINVNEAWAASYAPTAMTVYGTAVAVENNHHMPRLGLPDLNGAITGVNNDQGVNVQDFLTFQALDGVYEDPSEYNAAKNHLNDITVVQNHGMDALSGIVAPLSVSNLYADYAMEGSIAANTELAVTFPVKYAQYGMNANASINDQRIAVTFMDSEEREERSNPADWQWSPWAPQAAAFLKEETNLIRLTHKDGVDREDLGVAEVKIPSQFTGGWMNIGFRDYNTGNAVVGGNPVTAPAIGFSNIVVKNTVAIPGVNNTYSITHDLKRK